MNPSLKLRGGPSGPTFGPSTPGYVLTIQADGATIKPESPAPPTGDGWFTQAIVTVPALAAAFADVVIGVVGSFDTHVGDVFALALADDPGAPRLADIAPVNAFCAADGTLTIRFFGTTAGGPCLLDVAKVHSAAP